MKKLLILLLILTPFVGQNKMIGDCGDLESAMKQLQKLQNNLLESGSDKTSLKDLKRIFNNHMSDFQMYRGLSQVKVKYLSAMKGKAEEELTAEQRRNINKTREDATKALQTIESVLGKIAADDSHKAIMLKQNPGTFFQYLKGSCPQTDIKCRKNMDDNSKLIKNLLSHWVKGRRDDGIRGQDFLKYLKMDLPSSTKREELLESWVENEHNEVTTAKEKAAIDIGLTKDAVKDMEKEFGSHISKKLNALWERDKTLSKKPNGYIPKNWDEFQNDLLNSRVCKNEKEGTPIDLELCFKRILGDSGEAYLIEEEREKISNLQSRIDKIQRTDNYKLISKMLKTIASRSIIKRCGAKQVVIGGECFTQDDASPIQVNSTLHAVLDKSGKIIAELDPSAISSEKDFIKMCGEKLGTKKMVSLISQVCSGVKPYKQPKAEKIRDERDYRFNMAQVNEDIICSGDGGVRVMGCVKPKGIWGIIGKAIFKKSLGDPQFLTTGLQTLSFDQTVDPMQKQAEWYKQYLKDKYDWEQNIFFPNFATYFKYQSNPWWNYNASFTSVDSEDDTVGTYYNF